MIDNISTSDRLYSMMIGNISTSDGLYSLMMAIYPHLIVDWQYIHI